MSPIYERECRSCGFFRETPEKITASRTIECPECGEKKFKKIVSAVNFQIRGASAKNGYTRPPTNEEMGMESERTLLKKLESDNVVEEMSAGRQLSSKEKELAQQQRRNKITEKLKKDKHIKKLKEKHPEFSAKLDGAMAEGKGRSVVQRDVARKERAKKGVHAITVDRGKIPD